MSWEEWLRLLAAHHRAVFKLYCMTECDFPATRVLTCTHTFLLKVLAKERRNAVANNDPPVSMV